MFGFMNNILNKIASSSSGNCYIYNQDLMIDIGVSFKKIKPYLKDIKLILLSHCHQDHFSKVTIKQVSYNYPNIKFVCGIWLVDKLLECGVLKKNIYILEIDRQYDFGKYIIEPVLAIHDVQNCGYKITIKENDYKIFHISDTSSVKHIKAKNFNWYSIEANYKIEELEKRKEQKILNNEYVIEDRILNSHLCEDDAIQWLKENMGDNSEYTFIHQHVDKNIKKEGKENEES